MLFLAGEIRDNLNEISRLLAASVEEPTDAAISHPSDEAKGDKSNESKTRSSG